MQREYAKHILGIYGFLEGEKANCIGCVERQFRIGGVDGGYCKGEKRNLRSKKKKSKLSSHAQRRVPCIRHCCEHYYVIKTG